MEQARSEVLSIAARGPDGDRIGAIKVLRERTGVDLREASDTVKRSPAAGGLCRAVATVGARQEVSQSGPL